MENQPNSSPTQNENQRPNAINSIDGFARPQQPPVNRDVSGMQMTSAPQAQSPAPAPDTTFSPQQPNNAPQEPAQEAHFSPMAKSSGNGSNSKSKMWTIVLIILIIVVFAGGIAGVYLYQQKKINDLNAQLQTLTGQKNTLDNELAKLQSQSSTTTTPQPTSVSSSTAFKMPELGAQLTVPSTLADINYTLNAAKTAANLSTTTLGVLDASCKATTTVAPLGIISKVTGQYPTTSPANTTLLKQYPTYYIDYVKPTANCSTIAQVNTLQQSLLNDLKTASTSIATTN